MGDPARGYSWPPFEPGNRVAEKHGARSDRAVLPLAGQLLDAMAEVAPHAADPAFRATLERWAYATAQARLLRRWLEEHGPLDDDGEVRGAATYLQRVEATAAKAEEQLGLTPRAWAQLVATLAQVEGQPGSEGLADGVRTVGARLVEQRRRQRAIEAGDGHANHEEQDHDDDG